MALVLNVHTFVNTTVNSEYEKWGDLYVPVQLSTTGETVRQDEIELSGAATTQVYAASAAATLICLQATVAVTYLIVGTATADNSALVCPAGFRLLLPGSTTAYANTYTGRAAAADQAISAVYAEHGSSGKCKIMAFR